MTWQWRTLTMKEKLLHLMKNEEMCDITVIVGPEKKSFSTHSWLLSMFSDVLQTKILHLNTNNEKEILLPEEKIEDFRIFLRYIYTEEIKLNSIDEAISCLSFARKFNVRYMINSCIAYLNDNLTTDSILSIYEASVSLLEETFKSKCWKYITENIWKIIKQENVKHVSFETMLKMASEDKLQLESEVDMYNAIIKWGKENYPYQSSVDLRETLRPLLHQVRFLTMTSKQFTGSPCEDGILTKDEQLAILKELSSEEKYESDCIDNQWRKPRNIFEKRTNLVKPSIRTLHPCYIAYECSKTIAIGKFPHICKYFRSLQDNFAISGISLWIGCILPSGMSKIDNYYVQLSIRVYGRLFNVCSSSEINKKVTISENPSEITVKVNDAIRVNKNELFKIDFQSLSRYDYKFKYCSKNCSFRLNNDQLGTNFQPKQILSEVDVNEVHIIQNNHHVNCSHFSTIHTLSV